MAEILVPTNGAFMLLFLGISSITPVVIRMLQIGCKVTPNALVPYRAIVQHMVSCATVLAGIGVAPGWVEGMVFN